METELWPNLLSISRARGIPVVLANARLSERSARRYARWPALTRLTLGALAAVGCQTGSDAERLAALGATAITVTGNIKFDITPPPAMLERAVDFRAWTGDRPIILLASSRDGEEALLVEPFLATAPAEALLIVVPRHPQRFDAVARLVEARGQACPRRSRDASVPPTARVCLGDSMGEMFAYYALADVALIGGSWERLGGQNLIEACAVGTPVVVGPHTFNFSAIADDAVAAGAALRASDASTGMGQALALLENAAARRSMSEAGRAFAQAHRGATTRTLAVIEAHAPGLTPTAAR